jgi:hypothetical protein
MAIACELKQELERFVTGGYIQIEHWNEDLTAFKPVLYLHADTYEVERLFQVAPSLVTDLAYVLSPRSHFAYCNRILPEGMPLRNMGARARRGWCSGQGTS